jgi:4'-phosphopantetheinyl transferase
MDTVFFTNTKGLEQLIDNPPIRPELIKKMDSYKRLDDKLRSLAGSILMERIAGNKEIVRNDYGKPVILNGPHINLSHSGNFVCLVVSDISPVGIDIERRRRINFDGLVNVSFHPLEAAFFAERPSNKRFFDIWTLKESFIKMLGIGFSVNPKKFCIIPEKTGIKLKSAPPACLRRKEPSFRLLKIIEGYSVAICSAEPLELLPSDITQVNLI